MKLEKNDYTDNIESKKIEILYNYFDESVIRIIEINSKNFMNKNYIVLNDASIDCK